MVKTLLLGHDAIIQSLRVDLETCADKYHDIGTNDFLTGLMERHEKRMPLYGVMGAVGIKRRDRC
jgi:starvation-inducible DNA-binding protein